MFYWLKKRYKPNSKSFISFSRNGESFKIFDSQAFKTIYNMPITGLYIPGFSFDEFFKLPIEKREDYLETHITKDQLNRFSQLIATFCSDEFFVTLKFLGQLYIDQNYPISVEFIVRGDIVVTFDSNKKSYITITQLQESDAFWKFLKSRNLFLTSEFL